MALNIAVVCGSVRKNRNSIKVAKFLAAKVKQAGADSVLVDFNELQLPFVDSDPAPDELDKKYPYENVQRWSAIADAADGFVFVVPEYNHAYSAVFKNAMDWLYDEFNFKPALLVGVSNGAAGGRRALTLLPALMANFGIYAIRDNLAVSSKKFFDDSGQVTDDKQIQRAERMVAGLIKITTVMRRLRS